MSTLEIIVAVQISFKCKYIHEYIIVNLKKYFFSDWKKLVKLFRIYF